jgi:hypothetical protein
MNNVKILIKKYNSSKELENFFNDFSKRHEIINKEIRIVPFGERIIYFLIIEY